MRRTLRDILVFAAVPAALAAALAAVSDSVAPVYPAMKAAHDQLRQHGSATAAVSVGNSHADAIDFEALGVQGVQLGRGGADVFESRYVMARAFAAAPAVELVLFAVPIGGLAINNAVAVTPDRPDRRRELYARAGGWRWIPGDFPHFVAGRTARITRADHWKRVVRRLAGLAFGAGIGAGPAAAADDADDATAAVDSAALDAHAEQRVASSLELADGMLALDPGIPARAEAALRAAALSARQHGVTLVFYTAPLAPGYLARLPHDTRARFHATLHDIAAGQPCALYLDFSDHPDFQAEPAFFSNSDHLKAAGARHFSRLLRDRIAGAAPLCRGHAAAAP